MKKDNKPEFIAEKVDISNRHEAKKFAQEVVEDLGGLDALVLNASAVDFHFKDKSGEWTLPDDEIKKKMFQTNLVGNVALIREAKGMLKQSNGTIVFLTTRFISKDIETASAVDSKSFAAQEDIGNYIDNKKRMHAYLDDFIKDEQNEGIFVFSVIPGTVDTPSNRMLIEVGTQEMSEAKIKEREEGRERNPEIVGRIITKMTITRKKFNPETNQYDIDIQNGEIVEVSNAAVEFEEKVEDELCSE